MQQVWLGVEILIYFTEDKIMNLNAQSSDLYECTWVLEEAGTERIGNAQVLNHHLPW